MYSLRIVPRLITCRTARWAVKRNYMEGVGGRNKQNTRLPGGSWEEVKKHYSLMPIFAILGFAVVVPALYCVRLATQGTDVIFNKTKPEPWNDWNDKAFKFINIQGAKEAIPSPRPDYKN